MLVIVRSVNVLKKEKKMLSRKLSFSSKLNRQFGKWNSCTNVSFFINPYDPSEKYPREAEEGDK